VSGWRRMSGCVFRTGFLFFTEGGIIDGAVVLISGISYVEYFT